ncbi:vWA domain-containing protein [Flavobacterium undicola]|uniref:vWA domain-containing protein n=1 Tax=Flavobacterium undicola TaxID=1932779 RepID=UPI0013780825|nr:BatA and WFA domain-containing protein [Flavobacterium undicola]MBA0884264.1 BatA domain-containing protein [Flavobacterium undicola]
MQFKHPEILYFLFLLIVPVLVHLFQFRRFKKEYFTNVQFLKSISIQTRKSSQLKKWLLLCCRLLLLTFVILAFAQPFFEAKDNNNRSNEMYIILDNSFSMQAKGKKGELLKRAVQELLEETPENTNFSLLTNTESYWNTDIKSIRSTLQNLKYSAIPFELDHLLAKINAHPTNAKKDIIIITDAIGIDQKQLKSISKNDVSYFIIPKSEQKNNVAVDSVFINETTSDFYDINVALSSYGDAIKPVSVAIYNQNKLIAKTVSNLESPKKSLHFSIPKQAFHGYVSISDNGLTYDNTFYFSISKVKKTNIISIGEASKSNFLQRIYTNDEFNYSNSELAVLNYNNIEKQDVVVLNELDEIPQALQITLKAFVQKGGNLIVIPSAKSSITTLNSFLGNFGRIQFKNYENVEKLITKINFNHPLFSGVFENKITNFQYPSTKASFAFSSSSPAALFYDNQSTFLTALQSSISAVCVFSAPINTENSNFQQSPLIVPTFYKMALYNQKNGINALTIGNQNPFIVDASLSKDAILEVKNSSEQFIPIQQIMNTKVKMTFNDLPLEAGNFEIYNQKQWVENISFNYNRSESNLNSLDNNSLSQYNTSEAIESVFHSLQTDRMDNQLWKWFVIFALLFLLCEMAIIKFLK